MKPQAGFLIVRTFEDVFRAWEPIGRRVPVSGSYPYSVPRPGTLAESIAKKYRGIDRTPLLAWPVKETGTEHNPCAAEEPEAFQRMWELEDNGLAAEDFVLEFDDARQLFACLRHPAVWEIIWARNASADGARDEVGPTLGFEPTYFWPDHFSAVCDCMCFPRWHGTDKEGVLFAEYHNRLNAHALFETPAEAEDFLRFYLSHDWTERGDYVIAEIRAPRLN